MARRLRYGDTIEYVGYYAAGIFEGRFSSQMPLGEYKVVDVNLSITAFPVDKMEFDILVTDGKGNYFFVDQKLCNRVDKGKE